jgi:hypothetical protein
MNTHTKGPWEARQSVRGYWFIEHQQGGEAYTLTKLDCSEADSRLIASAPDLLAALEGLLEYLHEYDLDYPESASIFDNARAVIAEATGEQS